MYAAGMVGVALGMAFQSGLSNYYTSVASKHGKGGVMLSSAPAPTTTHQNPAPSPSGDAPLWFQHPAAEFGLPGSANLVVMKGYVSSLNLERRIPNWVIERIDYQQAGKKKKEGDDDGGEAEVSRASSKFYPDQSVPPLFRADNPDYSTPGMSRGHLAAAQFHKYGDQQEMNETFNLSANIVPQDMTMNGCDWYRLESMTKKLSKEFPRGLFVVTGPLFVPTIDTDMPVTSRSSKKAAAANPNIGQRKVEYYLCGKNDVAVPTHMFKVLLGVREDSAKGIAAFVLPNAPITQEHPMTHFQVPPSYVERLTGLNFFPSATSPSNPAYSPATSVLGPAGGGASSGLKGILGGGVAEPYDLCKKHQCEGSYASFSRGFRASGKIRSASTLKEAEAALQEAAVAGLLDSKVQKEFDRKVAELK